MVKIKKILCFAAMSLVLLSGCGKKEPANIAMKDLQNEKGEYAVAGMEWGCTDEEVKKGLGIEFGASPLASSDSLAVYSGSENVKILDYDANVQAEYQDGGLSVLTFTLEVDDPEAVYEELGSKLQETYGEHSTTENDTEFGKICNKLWMSELEQTTVLQLTYMEGSVLIALGLN